MTIRTSGSVRTTRVTSPWSAIRARSSPSTAAQPGARGSISRRRSSTTSASPTLSPTGSAPASRKAARCASPPAATTARSRIRDWQPVGVIEYGYVVPDPLDPDIIYGAGRNVVTRTHLSTGQVQDITPIPLKGAGVARRSHRAAVLLSARSAPDVLRGQSTLRNHGRRSELAASSAPISPGRIRVRRTSVGTLPLPKAEQQRGAIYAASASSLHEGLIWAGTDDGLVWVTRDGGKAWQNVTPPPLTPWSKVTQIEASHFDADRRLCVGESIPHR